MTERASNWSVTLNMKNISQERCEDYIEAAKGLGWGIEGQIEEGEEGTRHYQLLVKTPQIRFSAVKKVFPTAHIEKARNVSALKKYVHKDETRVGEFKTVENRFVQFKDIRDKFFEWVLATYYTDEEVDIPEQDYMGIWDKFIGISIREGIECDVIGVNPQYRSCIGRYWKSYVRRQIDRQTDRQTETSSETSSITQDGGVEGNEESRSVNTTSTSQESESYQDGESQTTTSRSESIDSRPREELYQPILRDQVSREGCDYGHVQWKYCRNR